MKKFTIQIDLLREAVKKLQQAVSDKAPIPIIENLLVQKAGPEVVFIATDLELTIFYKCPCEGDGSFDFLMPFKDLKRIVAVELGDLEISIDDKRAVLITGAQDVFNLGITPEVEEFPNVTRLPKKNSIELNGTLVESLNAALLTCGKDELRPGLSNILLDFKKNELIVVSTDTSMLYTKRHAIKSDLKEQLLISPKIAKALDGFIKTTVFFNANNNAFESEQITVIIKRHEEKYPNYKAVIPTDPYNATCDREELDSALEKCGVIESEQKETVFTLLQTQFEMESSSADTGKSARTIITGTYEGPVGNIALNGKRLRTLLSQIPKDVKKIRLSITAENRAVTISPEGDDSMVSLIMPITTK